MKETIKNLKPVERLFLISKERPEVYEKKNKVFCLLYTLINNENLLIKDIKTLNVNYNSKIFPNDYEMKMLDLIQEKKYLELNNMIDKDLVFNKTLIDAGIFKEETTIEKKFFFVPVQRKNIIKTTIYHQLQGHFSQELDKRVNVLNLVCEDTENYHKIKRAYQVLKVCMKKAQEDKIAEEAAAKAEKENNKKK